MLRSAEKRNRKRERERDDADGMVVMTGIKPIINHQHERTKKSDWSRWKIDAGDKSRFPFESDSIDSTLSRGGVPKDADTNRSSIPSICR